jgi:histidine ammonia-lyase
LAMISAVMIGLEEAEAYYNTELLSATEALKKAGLKPTKLGAKEAMGLTNGSNFIAAFSVFAIRDAENLIKHASIAGALSLEAIRGEKDAFSELINENRPHSGQVKIASVIRNLIKDSKRISPEAQVHPFTRENEYDVRVQDRYSFRGIPQVHGVVVEAVERLKEVVNTEINSATDNPLFKEVDIEEMKVGIKKEIYEKLKKDNVTKLIKGFSGANFHGQPLATVIDYLKIAITSLGLISDKRSFSLLSEELSYGLPADLALSTKDADGGLMIVQYAGAARAAENRVLSTPSSVMSISTAANQEDFVSMGANGALHLKKIIENTEKIVAVEILCAHRGIQLTYDKLPETPKNLRLLGQGTSKVFEYLSKNEKLKNTTDRLEDHYLRVDMEEMISILKSGDLVKLV